MTSKKATLASRNHLCVHEDVKEIKDLLQKNTQCKKIFSRGQCGAKKESDKLIKKNKTTKFRTCNKIEDIEDVVQWAKSRENQICPFYWLKAKTCLLIRKIKVISECV